MKLVILLLLPDQKAKAWVHAIIEHDVSPSYCDTFQGQGYAASSLLINFWAHKPQTLLFRLSDWYKCVHRAFTSPLPLLVWQQPHTEAWKLQESILHLVMHGLLHMVRTDGQYWFQGIIFFYDALFSARTPLLIQPTCHTECWMYSSQELLCTDNLGFLL